MGTMLKVLLTNEKEETIEFLDDNLTWTEEGSFVCFRDNTGKRVMYHVDCLAKFDFTQKWNVYAEDPDPVGN